MAWWLGESGRVSEAVEAFEALLADEISLLGAGHPDTLASRNSLAHWLGMTGRVNEAVEQLRAVLADEVSLLGAGHRSTLVTWNTLTFWLGRSGRLNEAVEQAQALLADDIRVLGPDHPDTLATRASVAFWQAMSGQVEEAVEQLLALLERPADIELTTSPALSTIVAVNVEVRDYQPGDEEAWLRCRVLSFLHTAYFDDVQVAHPSPPSPGFGLVAVEGGDLVGVIDVSVSAFEELATIETVAVHPDAQHRGVGTALLSEARYRSLRAGATMIDAWTRDDEPTLRWYRSRGFVESDHYLHVYANYYTAADEPGRAVESTRLGLKPVIVFSHAKMDAAQELRGSFARVHVCRRFSQPL